MRSFRSSRHHVSGQGPKHLRPGRRRWPSLLAATSLVLPLALALPGMADAATSTVPSVVDYSQCANGAPPSTSTQCPSLWINGILQGSNSHYREDQAVPQRTVVAVPAAGSGASHTHTLTYSYLTRKDSASAHAYDSLTTWNLTQSTADRCQGLKAGTCPAGSASTLAIPPDHTAVTPVGAGISADTSTHSIPGVMTMYGGTLTAVSTPAHSNPTAGTGDDYATITVTYTVPASTKVQNAELLFAGHLASSADDGTGWGTGLGASNINGGPYHIKFTALDGASAGSRDNQIQASAILPLAPSFAITKSASPTTTNPGATVTYTVTVTNNGAVSGSTTFNDVYDSRVTILTLPSTCTNNTTTHTLTCTTGTLSPGQSQSFVYTASMPTSFTGTSGGGGCTAGQFPVTNTATLSDGGSASATVCVSAAPAFTINKVANPTTANPGDTVTYTVTVTNTGTASGSTSFNDVYDSRVTILSVAAGCSNSTTTHTLTCTTGTLNAGQSQSFVYTAKMPASFTGSGGGSGCTSTQYPVSNTATLTGGGSSGATVCVNAAPAFTISKSASPTTAAPGATVTYTVTVTNTGTAPGATSFNDVYDSRVTITSVPGGCTNSTTTHTLTCTTGTLSAGGSQSFVYTAKMPASFTGSGGGSGCTSTQYPVTNTATLTGGGSSSATVCINAAPAFVISKAASPTTANPGDTVTYTVTVTNNGTAPGATSFNDVYDSRVTITNVPGGCTNSTANHTLTCTTGTLNPGGSQSFVYTAKMPASFTGSGGGSGCTSTQYPVTNTATLTGGGSSSATVCVNAAPHFLISKAASPTTANPGDTVTYTVTVTNNGTAPGSTTYADVYDSRITLTSVPSGCTNSTANHTLTCTTGTLNPGQSKSFVYTATMPASFTGSSGGGGCTTGQFPVSNTATLTGGGSSSATVCVNAAPHFLITKAANPSTASPGDTVTYTVTVTNNGTASGATSFSDVYDSRVTIVGVPSGCSNSTSTHTLSCTTAILDAGQSQSFVYTASMPTSFSGAPGGSGCTSTQFPVTNTATLVGGGSSSATVCVNAPVLSITKVASCVETAVPGGFFSYTITVTNTGSGTAGSVTLTDVLPPSTTVASAGDGTFSAPTGPVTWSLGSLAPTASASRTLVVRIDPVANGTTITNTATATAPGAAAATATFAVPVIDVINGSAKASASGRAYGLQANLLDLLQVPATPDTAVKNPDSLLTFDSPAPVAGVLHAGVMSVDSSRSVTPAEAADVSTATTADLRLVVPGALPTGSITISASTLVARSQSHASAVTAGSSYGGSTVQNLVINGTTYGNISTPTTIDVHDPITGLVEGHVYVLESTGTGAAKPTTEPEGTAPNQTFNSGLSVNALHVSLVVAGVHTDVVVAHADSTASFPAGLGCQPFPSVRGDAYVLDTPNLNPPLAEVKNGLVTLPSTGGQVDSAIADLAPLGTGTGLTHVDGTITLFPTAAQAHASATLNTLNLFSGAITATTVKSTSDTVGATSTGGTTIEHLVIGGTDICALLGLSSICSPPENDVLLIDNNTVLVELRETIRGGDTSEMRVNAVHVFVIGKNNPFNLPVGAEVVLSSSFSGVRLP